MATETIDAAELALLWKMVKRLADIPVAATAKDDCIVAHWPIAAGDVRAARAALAGMAHVPQT